jgi:hypothetical protein
MLVSDDFRSIFFQLTGQFCCLACLSCGTQEVGSEGPIDIRQRGVEYQIRLFGGQDPVTDKQIRLAGPCPGVCGGADAGPPEVQPETSQAATELGQVA